MFGFGTKRAVQRKRGAAGSGGGSNGVSATSFALYSASPQAALPSGWSISRASTGTYFNSAGILQTATSNAARVTHDPQTGQPLGLLMEPAATNEIRNNMMQGVSAGAPGTLPANWAGSASINGLNRQIIGSGIQNGISYVDIRFSGTTTAAFVGTVLLTFESNLQVAASSGQTWTSSAYLSLIGGSLANITSLALSVFGTSSGGTFLEKTAQAFAATANLTRFSATRTFSNASTSFALPAFEATIASGLAVDFTLRVGLPQLEQGSAATTPILTTGANALRAAETLSIANLNAYAPDGAGYLAGITYQDSTATNSPIAVTSGTTAVTATSIKAVTGVSITMAPAAQYHPNSQNATLDGSNRVLSSPDIRGLAALSGTAFGGGTVGPVQMTDGLGRKFWRFTGNQYLLVANSLNVLSARGVTVMGIWRKHNHKAQTTNFFSPRYSAYTDDSSNTNYSGGSTLRALQSAGSANFLHGASISAATDSANAYKMIPGCQLHLAGVASRTTANGGQRFYLNLDTANCTQSGVSSANCTGGVIGGVPQSGNGANASNNYFDLYELALWKGELTNAQADKIAAAMVANWSTPAITQQVVLDGDSITDGISTALAVSPTSGDNIGMQLSEPGSSWLPAGTRVINLGTSGAQSSDILAERDAANSTYSMLLPGGPSKNITVFQIGRNDVAESQGKKNSQMLYADVVALLNTPSTGLLQRGWTVTVVANIATSATAVTTNVLAGETDQQQRIENYRALIADTANHVPNPAFLNDCHAGAGQTYDGLLNVLHLYDVIVGGDTKFKDSADAQDTASGYYDSDQTHLRVAGIGLMVTGGDSPQHGYASIL